MKIPASPPSCLNSFKLHLLLQILCGEFVCVTKHFALARLSRNFHRSYRTFSEPIFLLENIFCSHPALIYQTHFWKFVHIAAFVAVEVLMAMNAFPNKESTNEHLLNSRKRVMKKRLSIEPC